MSNRQIGCLDRRGFTLIELLVVIALIGLLVALLLPAVQAAREASRRAQCTSNLKQLALANATYENVWTNFPSAGVLQRVVPGGGLYNPDGSPNVSGNLFLALLPFLEQRPLYDAVNFDVNVFTAVNATIPATGLSVLWCPSDPGAGDPQALPDGEFYDPGPFTMYYSSYAGNMGTWWLFPSRSGGKSSAGMNGPFVGIDTVAPAEVTDGLSQTIALGEHTRAILGPADRLCWHWWVSGTYGDTTMTTYSPMNPQRVAPDVGEGLEESYVLAASSRHPGGCNFAFLDGSVRFLKETIDAWRVDRNTGLPPGLTIDFNALGRPAQARIAPGTRFPVYQALSTRNGGEVIDSASY
jgi:prepilin-type N-terminal cleavage/methylation domain-containing protein/prepilin-type processing-associated H-X9-DG protein